VTLLRRYLVLAALLFWQGGFTFYAAVVVPTAFRVFNNSHVEQARVTVHVSRWLNVAGAITLPLLLWETLAARDPDVRRRRVRLVLWAGLLLTLAALFALHPWLDTRFDAAERRISDAANFRLGHKVYLWISAAQWVCGLAFLGWTLAAWRQEDRRESEETKKVPPLTTSASPSHRSSPAAERLL
jgi:hypothetical protein